MKKIVISLVFVLTLSLNAFAIDFSVGATVGGWGPTFARGDWKALIPIYGSKGKSSGFTKNMAFAPVAQVMGQVDFIPYFGIELGIGYSMKNVGGKITTDDGIMKLELDAKYSFSQLSIPLLLKGQYEIADMVNIYLGVGPKFNFNIAKPKTTMKQTVSTAAGSITTDVADEDNPYIKKDSYNMFDMDLSAVIGAEYKLMDVHYIGLRVGYDFNLINTMKKVKTDDIGSYELDTDGNFKFEKSKAFVDDLAISLTYRYKFAM